MLDRAREKMLERKIVRDRVPPSIAVIISSKAIGPRWWRRIGELAGWCTILGVREAALFPELAGEERLEDVARMITEELSALPAKGRLLFGCGETSFGAGGPLKLIISIGRGGKEEVTEAIRSLLEEVNSGLLDPQEIDEAAIEARLQINQRPDLLIRLGDRELSDFMIWQSTYSELYFIDRSWHRLKKIDFLSAVRDYQRRDRRFGR
ncbi:MAG TPA: undecaprenyl diphosphate synthase family protein [Methanothrix sp.]|nr:undecaprenyl diphosphate synthase family protein [Methanothrix sp.]